MIRREETDGRGVGNCYIVVPIQSRRFPFFRHPDRLRSCCNVRAVLSKLKAMVYLFALWCVCLLTTTMLYYPLFHSLFPLHNGTSRQKVRITSMRQEDERQRTTKPYEYLVTSTHHSFITPNPCPFISLVHYMANPLLSVQLLQRPKAVHFISPGRPWPGRWIFLMCYSDSESNPKNLGNWLPPFCSRGFFDVASKARRSKAKVCRGDSAVLRW